MRVLWFAVTPGCYRADSGLRFNGGGWVAGLQRSLMQVPGMELGVAFEMEGQPPKVMQDGVTYYPFTVRHHSRLVEIMRSPDPAREEAEWLKIYQGIVDDFRPEVIQCFGTEWPYGLLAQRQEVAVVIHMQGAMMPYLKALYPAGYTLSREVRYYLRHFSRRALGALHTYKISFQRAQRELRIAQGCQYFMGRTEWDRGLVDLYAPEARYFHCEEMLRPEFYEEGPVWHPKPQKHTLRLLTVGNGSMWKGLDLLLRTANALTTLTDVEFEWMVAGTVDNRGYIEEREGLRFERSHVRFIGVLSAAEVRQHLADVDIYVHTSHIDNSPNALCEAMMTGTPCIATNVGGVGSMIEHGVDGLLVPANESFILADTIKRLGSDPERQASLGSAARERALRRHDPEAVVKQVVDVYTAIISESHA